jgi:hypothetical protein
MQNKTGDLEENQNLKRHLFNLHHQYIIQLQYNKDPFA